MAGLPYAEGLDAAPAENGKAFVSPVVARIAAEHGIDPSDVPGTGTGGRVTKKDILAFIETGAAASADNSSNVSAGDLLSRPTAWTASASVTAPAGLSSRSTVPPFRRT